MALSPMQVLDNKEKQFEAEVKELEKYFDNKLTERFDGNNAVSIECPESFTQSGLNRALKLFRDAEWECEVKSSYQSTYVVFSSRVRWR